MELSFPMLILDVGVDSTCALLRLSATEEADWPRTRFPAASEREVVSGAKDFLTSCGVDEPAQVLVCGMGFHREAEQSLEGRAARMAWWREELRRSEGFPERCFYERMPGHELQVLLELLREEFGAVSGADSGIAALWAAMRIDSLRDRSWNEGVTVVYAGDVHTQAFMVFQERLLGLYEHHADLPREELLNHLKEVRLNWLPDEQVRAAGGHGCICGDFPPEAEGFRPTWVLGPRRDALTGSGRLVSPCGDPRFDRCFGLLYGFGRFCSSEDRA